MANWEKIENEKLTRTFKFKNFKEGLDFTNKVGEIAEEENHHPDIHLSWGKVIVDITTHEEGGLTDKDYQLADKIDDI